MHVSLSVGIKRVEVECQEQSHIHTHARTRTRHVDRYPCQSYVDLSRSSVGVVVSCIVAVFVIGVVYANDDSGGIHAAVFEL